MANISSSIKVAMAIIKITKLVSTQEGCVSLQNATGASGQASRNVSLNSILDPINITRPLKPAF